jgi:hypothetical protein
MATTANTALRVSELDFNSIRNNLKTFLRSQDTLQDYDFDGSALSVLIDVLAYNTHYMGYYLNVVGNEMFLDTAQLRPSITSHAKLIDYIPTSKRGSIVSTDILVTPSQSENQNVTTITMDRYTKFLSTDLDGVNYQFVATNANTAVKSNGSFQFSGVWLQQGEIVTHQFLMDASNANRSFELPSANVDTSSLIVTVQESASNTHTEMYILSNDITTITSNSAVYFIEENPNQNYTLYFGDSIIGKRPADGSIIICTYLNVTGTPSNDISKFLLSDAIDGQFRDNVVVTATTASYSGAEKESIEAVRFHAPIAYTTQNRAVTKLDYQTLIKKDYINIDSVSVWGGEDNIPIVYGKVYISLKTKHNYVITNQEKENIKAHLIKSRNVLTVTPEIVDPDYVYLLIRGEVNYNPSLTSFSKPAISTSHSTGSEILEFVKASIIDYQEEELNRFDSVFRKSKLQSYIDNSEKSILASDISVYIQKRVQVDVNRSRNYEIKFNTPLKKGDYVHRFYTNPQIYIVDISGVQRLAYFEEVPQSATGVDTIYITNPGFNYLTKPTVTIIGDGSGALATASVGGGKVIKITVLERGTNYNRADVFIEGDGSEAQAVARLEARNGLLRTYYYNTDGQKYILNSNAGTIDYDAGIVVLTNLRTGGVVSNNLYDTNIFGINAPIDKEIILPLRNRILTIDDTDQDAVQIVMVAET